MKMKDLVVHSEDKILLHAFENVLEKYGYHDDDFDNNNIRVDDWNQRNRYSIEHKNIICYYTKKYNYHNDKIAQLKPYKKFKLPEQWNEAIDYIKSYKTIEKKPTYKRYDWVISDSEIFQITECNKSNGTYDYKIENTKTSDRRTLFVSEEMIERHATKEELFDYLMSRTDIEIGDQIEHINTEYKLKINDIKLLSAIDNTALSIETQKYMDQNGGDFLVGLGERGINVPLNMFKKANELKIKTDKNNVYEPEVWDMKYYWTGKKSKSLNIGCIHDIKQNDLDSFISVMKFCYNHDMQLSVNSDGGLYGIYAGNEYIMNDVITTDDINKLKKMLDEN
jgi:hypothetical protein